MKKVLLATTLAVMSMSANAIHVNGITHGSTTSMNEIFGAGVFLGITLGSAVIKSNEWSKANPDKVAMQNQIATYNCGAGYNTEMDAYAASFTNCKKVGPVLKF